MGLGKVGEQRGRHPGTRQTALAADKLAPPSPVGLPFSDTGKIARRRLQTRTPLVAFSTWPRPPERGFSLPASRRGAIAVLRDSAGWSPTSYSGILPSAARDEAWRHAGTEESDQAEKTPVTFSVVYFSQCSPSPYWVGPLWVVSAGKL
jgi:hypothetical protein